MTISVEDKDHIALEDLNSFDQRIDLMLALTVGVSLESLPIYAGAF